MKVRKAIIPAAGLGTRLLPNTKSIPKEMLPLVDKPVLQYIVEEAVAAGVEEILIITNRGKSPIEDYFDYAPDLEARLVIELDGSQHFDNANIRKDDERTAFIERYGLRVIRIPNNEVSQNFSGVCEYIDLAVKQSLVRSDK